MSRTLLRTSHGARARHCRLARDVNGKSPERLLARTVGFSRRVRRAWHAVARPLGRSRRMRRTPRCLRNLARRPAAAARPIDARSDRVAALSAARVIRLFQTYRVPSPARETDLSPPIRPRRPSCPPRCPPASRRSAPSSPRYVRARPARHAPRRESDDRAPSPSPTRGVRLGRYSHHRYFETAASRDDRTPGASSAIAIASQRRRVVRGARTTNATGPSDVRARSC